MPFSKIWNTKGFPVPSPVPSIFKNETLGTKENERDEESTWLYNLSSL